jgi:hypothetical protein
MTCPPYSAAFSAVARTSSTEIDRCEPRLFIVRNGTQGCAGCGVAHELEDESIERQIGRRDPQGRFEAVELRGRPSGGAISYQNLKPSTSW